MSIIIGVAGGLALFLYGIEKMSNGLQRAAGRRLTNVLHFLTSNTFVGVLSGLVITVLIQSSSSTAVMLVGFVKAGLLSLHQAIGPILGANIGTTVTAQMVSFNLTNIALPVIAIGFLIYLLAKPKQWKSAGESILGFGLLFYGMGVMSTSLAPLKDSALFAETIAQFARHPLFGVLIGALFTGVIQSSSAATAVIVALAMQNLISLEAGIALILGSNIGTCATALLASIGAGITARRVAVAHLLFNVIGVTVFMVIFGLFVSAVRHTAGTAARQLANAHTFFNVTNTLIFLPFVGRFEKLLLWLVPGKEVVVERKVKYLDKSALKYPRVAVELASKEMNRMAQITQQMLADARKAFFESDQEAIKDVRRHEETVDMLQEETVEYMSALLAKSNLAGTDSMRVTAMMMVVNDIERMADHANNVTEFAEIVMEENTKFSEEAWGQMAKMFDLVQEMVRLSLVGLTQRDKSAARQIWVLEASVDEMEQDMRQGHMKRMYEGVCIPRAGIIYVEMVSNLERIGDHTTNIADMVLEETLPMWTESSKKR